MISLRSVSLHKFILRSRCLRGYLPRDLCLGAKPHSAHAKLVYLPPPASGHFIDFQLHAIIDLDTRGILLRGPGFDVMIAL